jgi:hypothetical protein
MKWTSKIQRNDGDVGEMRHESERDAGKDTTIIRSKTKKQALKKEEYKESSIPRSEMRMKDD